MVHFTSEKSEIQWCTLIMVADQKLLDLARSLLQMISRTQENIGEMLKIQKRKNEMNHHILQDFIGLQKEVKSLLEQSVKAREVDQWWNIRPNDPLRNGPGMKTQRKFIRERWVIQRNAGNVKDITYGGTAQWGNIKRVVATKFLDLGISQELRTNKRSTWKPRGLVLNVQSK